MSREEILRKALSSLIAVCLIILTSCFFSLELFFFFFLNPLLCPARLLSEENVSSLRCFVLAWTLARFSFVAQPLEDLDGFKLCPFFLVMFLDLYILLEVLKKRTIDNYIKMHLKLA